MSNIYQSFLSSFGFKIQATKAASRPAKVMPEVGSLIPVDSQNQNLLLRFIREFTFPAECEYEEGHYGDINFVVSENVPGDDGGLTKWGIDQASHPTVDIEDLTAEQAEHIYVEEYWAVHWAEPDQPASYQAALPQFPICAGLTFFDTREVCGEHAAWHCLQAAMGLYPDGIPGPKTRAAVLQNSLATPRLDLMSRLITQRREYHEALAVHQKHDAQFLKGWLNRCDNLDKYLRAL